MLIDPVQAQKYDAHIDSLTTSYEKAKDHYVQAYY